MAHDQPALREGFAKAPAPAEGFTQLPQGTPEPPPPPPTGSPLRRRARGVLIFLVVVFHLVVLAVRNPLDLWYESIKGWMRERGWWQRRAGVALRKADRFTWKYTNLVGCEQRWVMFRPPLARRAPFLTFRVEFTDGTWEKFYSETEPDDPTRFFRLGGWQLRKLEDHLVGPPEQLASDSELALWEGYARHILRRWHAEHPDDRRTVEQLVFIRRRIYFPEPGTDPLVYDRIEEGDVAAFDASGRLVP